MEAIYYTVSNINGDYAELVSDDGQKHSLTMFLLPEDEQSGPRMDHSDCGKSPRFARRSPCSARARGCDSIPGGLPSPRALRSHPETSATEKRGFEIYRAADAVHPRPCIFDGKKDHLLLLRQMCIFSASAMSCSRKSGWAMEMMASARSQVDRPFRLIMPYSVTT